MKYPVFAIIICCGCIIPLLSAATASHEDIIVARFDSASKILEAQVELLKWGGGAIVGGLVTAVVALFACLQRVRKEQQESIKELGRLVADQADANRRLADSLDALRDNCRAARKS